MSGYEAALVALLEDATPGAVYRMRLPEDALLPAQTYQLISAPRELAHDGDIKIVTARVQVDCWADNPDVADDVADAGPRRLSGYADPFFQRIEVADDRELDEPDSGLYRRLVDLMLTYQEDAGS